MLMQSLKYVAYGICNHSKSQMRVRVQMRNESKKRQKTDEIEKGVARKKEVAKRISGNQIKWKASNM